MDPICPPEIWRHVFSFLDPVKDRRSASLACQTWNVLVWDALDPSENDDYAIVEASKRGCADSVRRLLAVLLPLPLPYPLRARSVFAEAVKFIFQGDKFSISALFL